MLRKAGKTRIAIMLDSPYHMYDQTRFSITEAGITVVEESGIKRTDSKVYEYLFNTN